MANSSITFDLCCDITKDEITLITVDFGKLLGLQKLTFFQPNKLMLKDLKNLKSGNTLVGVKQESRLQSGWSIAYDQEYAKYFLTQKHISSLNGGIAEIYGMATCVCLPTREFETAISNIIEFLETFRANSPGTRLNAIRVKAKEIDLECSIERDGDVCDIKLLVNVD